MDTSNTSLKTATILFVDDEESILSSLKRLMRNTQYECKFASSGMDALVILGEYPVDIVVSDMKMPEMSGEVFLAEVAKNHPEIIRIVLSGFSEEQLVMAAINQGRIWGFINKPWQGDELKLTLDEAIMTQQRIAERALLQRTVKNTARSIRQGNDKDQFMGFIGKSEPMQRVYTSIEKAAPSTASVFITGENGTGKELAAQALHALSTRKDEAFIALNCAAIPSELMESEIFGHVKGAFSGAINHRDGAASLADGGTLFFDEISEMDIGLQTKLLRFIQTGTFQKVGSSYPEEVDIRFICATNRKPLEAIRDKKLREDLFYRLNVITLALPPLRERSNDIYLLANSFLTHFSELEDKIIIGLSSAAEKLILAYQWSGNVRQLENCIHSAVIMSNGPLVSDQDIADALNIRLDEIQKSVPLTAIEEKLAAGESIDMDTDMNIDVHPLSKVEEMAIKQALNSCDGNVVRAAGLLHVSPSTLYRKIQSW